MVAPFVKARVVEYVLDALDHEAALTVVTRWRADEVAAGVSDLDSRRLTLSRHGRFMLVDHLHAKYYRSDDRVLIGSANLTGKGLGLSQPANLELLVRASVEPTFEAEVFRAAWEPDDRYQNEVAELAARLEVPRAGAEPTVGPLQSGNGAIWLPTSRQPEALAHVYFGKGRDLSGGAERAAQSDLGMLDLPDGLNATTFFDAVAVSLRSKFIIRMLDGHLTAPKRFGDLRVWMEGLTGLERAEAERATQTLIRWVTYFLDSRYRMSRPRHTEILERLE